MLSKTQKIVLMGAGISSASLAIAACDSCCPLYLNETVAPAFMYAGSSIVAAVSSVDAALAAQLKINSERLTSAIAVLTKQKAVSSYQITDANKTAAQVTASALNSLAQTARVTKARFDYGAEFGQGYNPCKISATRNLLNKNIEYINDKTVQDMDKEIIAGAGSYSDKNQEINKRIMQYKNNYCSAEQVKYGICDKIGELNGQALNISSLFIPSPTNNKVYQAKVDFINNLAGLPDNQVPPVQNKSSLAISYMQLKQQKDAMVSPALYTFKNIQNDYIENKGQNSSIAAMFEQETNRYMGASEDGSKWANSIAAQNQRGLLLEMLKVKALDLAIQGRQYEQQQRIEANLAILVANAAQKLGDRANNIQYTNNMQK